MVQILLWLHSTFKELSNEYSHAQIQVKTKKLWPRQVREDKPVVVQKISRDKKNCVATRKLGRGQEIVSRPENLVATKNAAEI